MDTTEELKAGDIVENRYGEAFSNGQRAVTITRVASDGKIWLNTGKWSTTASLVRARLASEGNQYDTDQTGGTTYPPMNIPASDRMVSRSDNGGPALDDDDDDDVVVKPAHYIGFAIEPVTFIMRNALPFWKGNVVKYACRAGRKVYDGMDATQSEITDLKKAIRYAEMRINQLTGETEL